jgi:hypothetical protein
MGARAGAALVLKPFACLAALLTALLLSPRWAAAVTFTASEITSGDTGSVSIVSGDFNNDGILDLVTVNDSTISLYKGLGGGQYAAPVNTSGGVGLAVAADFNGDGKLDLAIAESLNGAQVWLGNGDGTFTAGSSLNKNEDSATTNLAVADFNGDHIPDIVMNNCPAESPACGTQVYLGIGDGTFQMPVQLNYGGYGLVVGDFNADGHQDIATLDAYYEGFNGVVVYLGEGNGQFQSPLMLKLTLGTLAIAVGDFYNDRIQTLAVLTQGSKDAYVQTVQYSDGQLVANNPQVALKLPSSYVGLQMAAGDLNGDFKDGLVISGTYGESPNTVVNEYMLGTGKGTFAAHVNLPVYGDDLQYPFIRDLNLDSRHDIGLDWSNNNGGGGASVLLNDNAATNCAPPTANKLVVNICAPKEGETVGSTFTFKGAGNAFNGIAKRMELWIDGTKVGQNLEDQLKVTTTLSAGTHTASFVVVDSFDNYTSSSVSFVVK